MLSDFAFISNRVSSNISNIWFLVTVGGICGLSTCFYGYLLRVILYFQNGSEGLMRENFFTSPKDLIISFIATTFYMILFSSIGYFLGIVFKRNKIFMILIPALFIGSIYIENAKENKIKFLSKLINFYCHENSLFIFLAKVLIFSIILFILGIWISNRTEVR